MRHCRGSSDLDAFPAADPAESEMFGCKVFYKLHGISKLDDANDTGTKNSIQRTLTLTEGDSSKTLTTAGAVGRDCYSVSPLRGEVLNVREATHKQVDIYYCTLDSVNFDPSRCR